MESGSTHPSIEALLANATWMRALALAIVRDHALAEDLVQDAWVVALERPPQPRSAAGLRAWLSAVVSNLAHGRRRREKNRGAVERTAARTEAIAGDLDAVERLQLQRELTEILLELREPYRSAVILRHLEGLSAEEIGRRSNCSAETARQRVTRGLNELRQRLQSRPDRRGADRWLALVHLARASRSIGAGGVSSGVLLMSKSTWSVVSIAFGLLAAWLAWSALHATGPGVPSPNEGLARESSASAELDARANKQLATRTSEPLNARSAAQLPEAEVRAIVVARDRAGSLLEGISICVHENSPPLGATDEHGRFDVPWASIVAGNAPIAAKAVHDDFVSADFELVPGKTVELTLAHKPRVVFELVAPDGSVPERPWTASVWVRDGASGEVVQVRAEASAGELCARRLPVGRLERAEARGRGFATGQSAFQTQLEAESVLHVRIELHAGVEVSGRVIDSVTRDPIAGATVWAEAAFFDADGVTEWKTTDEAGHFELHGLESQSFHDDHGKQPIDFVWIQCSAQAEGYQGKLLEGKVQQANATGRYFVELELTPTSCGLSGRVIGTEGLKKLVMVQAVTSNGQLKYAFVASDGRFELRNLSPGVVWLFASNLQSESEPTEDVDPLVCARGNVSLEPGEQKEVELVLERPTSAASGRVIDAHGEPVAGIEVRARLNERQGMLAWGAHQWIERTNAQGEYAFEGLLSGEYSLEFGDLPNAWCVVENHLSIELGKDERRVGGRMVLSECVGIDGWVELNGHDPARLRVLAHGPEDRDLNVESPVAADSTFRLVRLPSVATEVLLLEGNRELARIAVGSLGAHGVHLRPEH